MKSPKLLLENRHMSLVVARKTGNEIWMSSDARICRPNNLRSGPLTGALKLVLTNNVCVGYAGCYHSALDCLRRIRNQCLRGSEEILAALLDTHKATGGEVDFIVATYSPSPSITRITNGTAELNLDAAWIGDPTAFAEYQRLYHSASPIVVEKNGKEDAKKCETASRMREAMSQLVREGGFSSVGEFVISARSSLDGFTYLGGALVFPATQTIPSGVSTPLRFGTAQEGGYGYSVLWPSSPNIGVIGVHFFPGDIGALYHPLEYDAAKVYSQVTFEQFTQAVAREFGIELVGLRIS